MTPGCIVKICFFKPEGYEDTHYVETDHRGDAVGIVLLKYDNDHLKYLNYISVTYGNLPDGFPTIKIKGIG